MGHIIGRHFAESESKGFLARQAAEWLDYDSTGLSADLALVRKQEFEAGHIALMLMADVGFNPQDLLGYVAREMELETESLNRRDPRPERRSASTLL